jgi:uncharacterized protein (DUF58 family)
VPESDRNRSKRSTGRLRNAARGLVGSLGPTERSSPTREGFVYFLVSATLLLAGLWQQVNLILLVFTLTAGPFLASIFGSRTILRGLSVTRRVPPYVFSGDPLEIDYGLENGRRWNAALALFIEDSLEPVDRAVSGSIAVTPRVFFARVAGYGKSRQRWSAQSPKRGKYRFRDLDLGTRSPFGIVEHRVTMALEDQITVYPRIGKLSRRWHLIQRHAMESRRGQRHDRSAQQMEYHGLRDYRSGDSPRWIHWRTSARRGELMVKEFEEQNEQDLAILIDPWMPRTKSTWEQREAVELCVSFVATVCLETCRHQQRRLLLGWTGAAPGVQQGPSSVKLLHELLEQLAMLKPASEGRLGELFDAMPPAMLREAILVIVSTRPINLTEEAERSKRLSGASARSLHGRVTLLNATHGDLAPLFQVASNSSDELAQPPSAYARQERPPAADSQKAAADSEIRPDVRPAPIGGPGGSSS